MRASVIIPSFQSAATIAACLRRVLAQDIGDAFEVLVVDSGTDATADIVRVEFPRVRLLKSATRIDAESARNWGAREARGRVLAFIDSDCVPQRDWLRLLCNALESGQCEGVGGAIRPLPASNAASWAGYFCEFREFLPRGTPRHATYLTPGNAAYRADVFRRAGGFPSGYFPLEDQVFYTRLRAVNARIRFDPGIAVRHCHRSTVGAFLRHQVRIGDANARVVRVLDIQGAWLAAHPWVATFSFPALTSYRFFRTIAACWREERYLMLRSPAVTALCWLGMLAWGSGFVQASANQVRSIRVVGVHSDSRA